MKNQKQLAEIQGMRLGKKPIQQMGLGMLLKVFGVKPKKRKSGYRSFLVIGWRRKFPPGFFYDLKDEVEKIYRKKIVKLHPDKGGDQKRCAELNAVYDLIQVRLKPFLT